MGCSHRWVSEHQSAPTHWHFMSSNPSNGRRQRRLIALALAACGALLIVLDPYNPLGAGARSIARLIGPAAVFIGLAGVAYPDFIPDTTVDDPDAPLPRPPKAVGCVGCLIASVGIAVGIVWAVLG
jgi:hypothetical protein